LQILCIYTKKAFLVIALVPDVMGLLIHETLDVSVSPFIFWQDRFSGYLILSAAYSTDRA
jgi:hypothetical protein